MDVVDAMAAYLPVVRVCAAQSREAHCRLPLDCAVHTHTTGKYTAITATTSISTDTIKPLL